MTRPLRMNVAGGMDDSAVSEAIRQFHRHRLRRAKIRSALRKVNEYLNLET